MFIYLKVYINVRHIPVFSSFEIGDYMYLKVYVFCLLVPEGVYNLPVYIFFGQGAQVHTYTNKHSRTA
jgi:hypothetical protein